MTDIVEGADGKVSMTKLAAASFHFALLCTVIYITVSKGVFEMDMWELYATCAIGHAVVDKGTSQLKDVKMAQIGNPTDPAPTVNIAADQVKVGPQ